MSFSRLTFRLLRRLRLQNNRKCLVRNLHLLLRIQARFGTMTIRAKFKFLVFLKTCLLLDNCLKRPQRWNTTHRRHTLKSSPLILRSSKKTSVQCATQLPLLRKFRSVLYSANDAKATSLHSAKKLSKSKKSFF